MSNFPETSTTLLARLAERETGIDQAAWRIFFERYQPVMVEFARLKGAGDDAEDVVQDVFANLARVFKAGRYVRDKGRFRNYLAKMLRNELVSRLRRERVRPEGNRVSLAAADVAGSRELRIEPAFAEMEADDAMWERARQRAAVEHILSSTALSEQSRRIYHELMKTGESCAAVARRLGLPAATVRQVKSRVTRMIAAYKKTT
ncbi:MAG: sigma-70 family RNA polymerase sigma factor [Kiritimatiellae bacterium]|nr:sigma-70 family RNA polymerase sigma factor [Kiritimatiellia bacterium]